jgi:DHA1 family inner membrane transport protein
MLMAGRVLAAFGQASFLGIGSVVAANLVADHLRSRAIAMVFTGITLANVLGTPLGTLLGQNLGWRAIFWVISAVAVLTFVVVAALVPAQPRREHTGYRAELAMFGRLRVWQTLAIGMLAMGAVFASFSYVAPLLTEVSGFAPGALTLLLALFGVGLVAGNLLGGWAADRAQLPTLCGALGSLTVVMVAFASLASVPFAAAAGLLLMGATGFAVIPAFLSRLINLAGGESPLAAATGGSAANLGTAFGAYVGGWTINLGLGFTAPSWLGATMAATGFGLALVVWIGHTRGSAPKAVQLGPRDQVLERMGDRR